MRTLAESSPMAQELVARLSRALGALMLAGAVLATSTLSVSACQQMTVTDMLRGDYSPIYVEPGDAMAGTPAAMSVPEMLRGDLSPI